MGSSKLLLEVLFAPYFICSLFILAVSVILIVIIWNILLKRRLQKSFDDFMDEINKRKQIQKEKELVQQEVFQAAKLASVGELAAGIGHEVSNPLMVISGNVEIIKRQLENLQIKDEIMEKGLRHMELSIDRIVNIINGLRTFVRSDSDKLQKVAINECLKRVISFLEVIYLKSGVVIEHNLRASDDILVDCNEGKMQQVFVNLLSNAKDAIEDSGRHGKIIIKSDIEDNHIVIQVIDSGKGIKEDDLSKIFDSFYTTKPVGKGTGLGLSIVKNIVEGVKGKIEFDSQYGVGTSVTITLPF